MNERPEGKRTVATASSAASKGATRLRAWFLAVGSCWTILIAILAGWDYWEGYSGALAIARSEAGDSIAQDLLYRRWACVYGGVYVPITAETPPNPYLAHVPERDIATPSGKKLTLMNPAYMTRQAHELGEQQQGVRGHITSLKPIRPESAPDEWENEALLAFEQGEKEVSSLEILGNDHYFRLMRPLAVERGCLTCHAAQGYKEGDIRGGLSVSVPWAPSREAVNAHIPMLLMAYGGIWAIGILGLCVFRSRLQRHLSNLKRAEQYREKLLARRQGINLLQQSLLEPAPLEDKLRKITDGIVRLFDADFCRVWLIRPGDLCQGKCIHAQADDGPHACRCRDRCLHLLASSGRYTHINGPTHRRVPFGCYKIGRIASGEDHKFLTNDAQNDPRVHNHSWARELGLVSFAGYQLCVPGGDALGVLALFAKHPIDESEDAMLDGLSGTIALVVQQAAAQEALRRSKGELQQYAAALESSNHALEELNHLAESATRAKSEFLANMSHEIRTPMTAILGFADVIREEVMCCPVCPDNTHCQKRLIGCEAVSVIRRNGAHLLAVINDILDLSKVEAGKMQFEPTRCSPIELLAEVVSLVRVRAEAKQLKLETDLAGPLPETVLTDPLRVRQVLVNLMGNAIKFTDHGEVRIAARLTDDRGHPRLRFDVTDTGIGISEEQVGKLFQPFSQVDSSASRKVGGTGLGLAISKRLTEAMGGKIEVHSAPGKGSTFSVMIDPGPLDGIRMVQAGQGSASQRPLIAAPAAADKIELHGRILMAEDGPDNQRLVSFLLKKAGADVTAVENGQLAVEAALASREAGQPFDVVLMDMQMPVMDGYTATRQLREQGYTSPIIALTAHAMAEDRQKCLDAGCDDYATKPIDRQKLLATVVHWASRSRTHNTPPDSSTGESKASRTMPPTFVYSHLAADLGKLVDLFVQEMPDRIKTLDAQAKSRDWNQLARTAHQMKGAAGSYGFDEITPCAARLEAAVREAQQEEEILSALDELVSLCRRTRSGTPPADPYAPNAPAQIV